MPLLRALPEPATFFEKKVDQKTKLGGFPAKRSIKKQDWVLLCGSCLFVSLTNGAESGTIKKKCVPFGER
jgi:hypothetical protein